MTQAPEHALADRGIVCVSGDDAAKLLQGVLTNDIDALAADHPAMLAGLLTPQGKILFEFLVVAADGGFLLDVARDRAADLAKRLSMYKLRARVDIEDASARYAVLWSPEMPARPPAGAVVFRDPRSAVLGWRTIAPRPAVSDTTAASIPPAAYDAARVAAGIGEGGRDYAFGDAFPHEASWDRIAGVSFSKGCFVGQEVVARMQHKTVVRKRIVRITGRDLAPGADITVGEAVVGKVGTVAGERALAMVRLDRAAEAAAKGLPLMAGCSLIAVDPAALADYARALAERPAAPELPS